MPTYFLPLGIEANSKEEAEQKVLKFQQIASEYKPVKESRKQDNLQSPQREIIQALALFGLLSARSYLDGRKQPSENIDWKLYKYEWELKRRKQRFKKLKQ